MEWIIDNKEWLFSGLGVAIIVGLFAWSRQIKHRQVQKGGHGSTNIQAGGDIDIGRRKDSE